MHYAGTGDFDEDRMSRYRRDTLEEMINAFREGVCT